MNLTKQQIKYLKVCKQSWDRELQKQPQDLVALALQGVGLAGAIYMVISEAEKPGRRKTREPERLTGQWLAIKKAYQRSRSPKSCARDFNVPVNTVKARARRGGW
jgi:hypothetical protein